MAEKLYRITSKAEFLTWAKEVKGLDEQLALKVWNEQEEQHKKWGSTKESLIAQGSFLYLKKQPSTGTFRALVCGFAPTKDWTEIARGSAKKTPTPDIMPFGKGKGVDKIPANSNFQASVIFLGHEVDKSGNIIGDYSMYSLNVSDDLNDPERKPDARLDTEFIHKIFDNCVGKVVEFTCGKARAKSDALAMSLFLMDTVNLNVKEVAASDLLERAPELLEKIAPARRVTMENIENYKAKEMQYLISYIHGPIAGVNETDDSYAILLSDGVYGETFTGWLSKDVPRIFPDSCDEAIILVTNIRDNEKKGVVEMDVLGVIPSPATIKRDNKTNNLADYEVR